MTDSIAYASANELATRIREGTLSATTVVETFLDRINQHNDVLNAFVTVFETEAIQAASDADQAVRDDDALGPLHGVPVAIKDTTEVKDTRTTYGSPLFSEHIARRDAIVVERLEQAGAIILGKTNTPEFARKVDTTNRIVGTTSNPWDLERTAGGSSGGSAAAVAAGLVPIAHGTDWGGSVRIPASACGLVGLKPDFGRIPDRVRPNAFISSHPYIVHGPLTRTVGDAALVMDVVAGPHRDDPYSLPARSSSYHESADSSLEGTRIAYCPDLGVCPVSDSVENVVTEAVAAVSDSGVDVDRVEPIFEEFGGVLNESISVLLQDRYIAIYEDTLLNHGIDILDRADEVIPAVVSRINSALELTPRDIHRAERVRTRAYDVVQSVFDHYEYLITPTLGLEPFPKGTEPTESSGGHFSADNGFLLTWPFNLTGHPAASLPAGRSASGLPIGLQLVGPRLGDKRVVEASEWFERQRPWAETYPPSGFE